MKLFINCLFCFMCFGCCSQLANPILLNPAKNKISGDSMSLNHFFKALDALQSDSCKTVSIVHIGDSHIQADYFSGMMRVLFQEKFGNAGRGLVFPYKLAHTNEPVNYISSSVHDWKGIRNVLNPEKVKLGISGISLFSKVSPTSFTIKVKDYKNLNYAFNSIDLFSEQSNIKNTRLSSSSEIAISQPKEMAYLSNFKLKDTTHVVNFQFSELMDIHGVVLKNGRGGILYHTIGVNGATFKSYNSTALFLEQLQALKPDLIIISLGTNESYDVKFNVDDFYNESNTLIKNLKLSCSDCSILITTPADNYKVRKKKVIYNQTPKLIGKQLEEYAKANHYALWNLYEVMGGEHSMKQWRKFGLAAKDHVHFIRKGYELQGDLLFEAMMNKYNTTN